jgi:hypothetical protein
MTETPFPAVGDISPEAVRARMAEFCDWFGEEPIKLKVRAGSVYMTDDLLEWLTDTGASIDWICLGEVRGMASTYRDNYGVAREHREFSMAIRKLDPTEQGIFLECMKANASGEMTFEEACADMQTKMAAHRAEAA